MAPSVTHCIDLPYVGVRSHFGSVAYAMKPSAKDHPRFSRCRPNPAGATNLSSPAKPQVRRQTCVSRALERLPCRQQAEFPVRSGGPQVIDRLFDQAWTLSTLINRLPADLVEAIGDELLDESFREWLVNRKVQ
jgi:hypothetical protein